MNGAGPVCLTFDLHMFVLRRQIGALDVETHLAVKIGQQRQDVLTWIRMINDDRKKISSEDAWFCVVVGLKCYDTVLMRSEYSQAFAIVRPLFEDRCSLYRFKPIGEFNMRSTNAA